MRKGIHPESHKIVVQMTDGNTFTTMSTKGKGGDKLVLQVDPLNHPLWTKKRGIGIGNQSRFAAFKNKYGNLSVTGAVEEAADDSGSDEAAKNGSENANP